MIANERGIKMGNLGKYQSMVEKAFEAGGVDEFLKEVAKSGAKKARKQDILILASAGVVIGAIQLFKNEIKQSSEKVKKYGKEKAKMYFKKDQC